MQNGSFASCCANKIDSSLLPTLLKNTLYGIEKEGLRVQMDGFISQTDHLKCFGSALTHPSITTDYSEALLEFITAPVGSRKQALESLNQLHQWTYHCLSNEYIWPSSMPCKLAGDASIPIAKYGHSNIGQMKHIYRKGLEVRYGRTMQSIAGIHYNFSLPDVFWQALFEKHDQDRHACSFVDFKSAGYFDLIRNFRRYGWLLSYLFGSSPALDTSFFDGKEHDLETTTHNTAYRPYATCLRMTDLGYKSEAQKKIKVCYNALESYISTLKEALTQPHADYAKIGLKENGEYIQLNTNLLQIENEFYSEIRPKRTPKKGQTPLEALDEEGIDYIEVRLMDINPFLPLGIDEPTLAFLEIFLIMCVTQESPLCTPEEDQNIKDNFFQTAKYGRDPELSLVVNGQHASLKEHAKDIFQKIKDTAQRIQADDETLAAISDFEKRIASPELTPSAQLLEQVKSGTGHIEQMLTLAQKHKEKIGENISKDSLLACQELAQQSHARQRDIENADTLDLDAFLAQYFNH